MASKFAKINPIDPEERKVFFDLMCKEICMMGKSEVLNKLLGIEGGSKSIKDYIPDMNDICKIIEIFDVECYFKITYPELRTDGKQKYIDHRDNLEEKSVSAMKEMKVCDTYKDMKKQAEDIKDPDLKNINGFIKKTDERDESFPLLNLDIPDAPDFLS